MSNLGARTKQIHLNVSEEEKTTLKTWADSQNITITQVLRNHIAKLKVFSDAELQALKTPNFVKQDFELDPESPRLTFRLMGMPKGFCRPCDMVRLHENGKCVDCGEWVIL
jgi:allophanate hydrolase subunit 2